MGIFSGRSEPAVSAAVKLAMQAADSAGTPNGRAEAWLGAAHESLDEAYRFSGTYDSRVSYALQYAKEAAELLRHAGDDRAMPGAARVAALEGAASLEPVVSELRYQVNYYSYYSRSSQEDAIAEVRGAIGTALAKAETGGYTNPTEPLQKLSTKATDVPIDGDGADRLQGLAEKVDRVAQEEDDLLADVRDILGDDFYTTPDF